MKKIIFYENEASSMRKQKIKKYFKTFSKLFKNNKFQNLFVRIIEIHKDFRLYNSEPIRDVRVAHNRRVTRIRPATNVMQSPDALCVSHDLRALLYRGGG